MAMEQMQAPLHQLPDNARFYHTAGRTKQRSSSGTSTPATDLTSVPLGARSVRHGSPTDYSAGSLHSQYANGPAEASTSQPNLSTHSGFSISHISPTAQRYSSGPDVLRQTAESDDFAVVFGVPVKYWALVILIVQNSSLVLLMRYTRTVVAGPLYVASTAVFFMELIKLISCCYLLFLSKGSSLDKLVWTVKREVFDDPYETLKMMVPSALYAVQNNLLFLALSNLDVATFQVTYQVKILTTAVFSVTMLGRSLSNMKWFSLLMLVLGVALVQLQSTSSPSVAKDEAKIFVRGTAPNVAHEFPAGDIPTSDEAFVADIDDIFGKQAQALKEQVDARVDAPSLPPNGATAPPSFIPGRMRRSVEALTGLKREAHAKQSSSAQIIEPPTAPDKSQKPAVGLLAVALACLSSGFAGVYFERILKRSNSDLWVRNIQLGIFGTIFSLVGMLASDGAAIGENGILYGYNFLAWLVVLNQAVGGLIVAVVVKYADNILKGFATSVSIIVSGVLSAILFDFRPSLQFTLGASVVIFAVYLYGRPDATLHTRK